MNTKTSRRSFLRRSAAAASLGALGHTLAQLRLVGQAAGSEGGIADYKALVCLFLQGGNDANNLIVPRTGADYTSYQDDRGILALPQGGLLPISPAGYATATGDNRDWGLHPGLGPLKTLFDAGDLAFVANTGTLVEPTTKATYLDGSAAVPPQLFSHSDQSVQWQSSLPDKPFQSGWGGRTADLLADANSALGADISMAISLAGTNPFQVGLTNKAVQYHVSPSGSISFSGYGSNYSSALNPDGSYKTNNAGRRLQAFHGLMAADHQHHFEQHVGDTLFRAYENDLALTAALENVTVNTPFPSTSSGAQLNMIARLVAAHGALCQQRQIFFCEIRGFDTHQNQLASHAALMDELATSVAAFHAATVELGLADNVTTFTASDFGRTYTPNGTSAAAGADHGWGSHALVCGGAVNGGELYGLMPDLTPGGPDDVNSNRGRWVPTTSVDEYAATIAKWFGVPPESMPLVFPNLSRFDTPDLGFMQI